MDINQVSYFLHLADTLNFTEAGAAKWRFAAQPDQVYSPTGIGTGRYADLS